MGTMEKLILTKTQTKLLTDCVRASTSPQRLVQRAGIILDYAQSDNKSLVASTYSVGRDTVRRWCERWQDCQAELEDLEAEYGAGTLSETKYRREIDAHAVRCPSSWGSCNLYRRTKTTDYRGSHAIPRMKGFP